MSTTVKGTKSNSDNRLRSVPGASVAEKYAEDWLKVFPNPSSGKFQISSSGFRLKQVEVYNLYGEKVIRKDILDGARIFTMDLSELPSGIYFLNIHTGGLVVNKKIVVAR